MLIELRVLERIANLSQQTRLPLEASSCRKFSLTSGLRRIDTTKFFCGYSGQSVGRDICRKLQGILTSCLHP